MTKNKFVIAIKKRFTASRLILLGFFSIILLGALLLMLPLSNASGQMLNFTDALFTATSATCVTGLTVKIIASDFTTFGHIIILVLIQIGGLGVMTITSALYLLVGKRFTLYNRMTLKSDFEQTDTQNFAKIIHSILKIVLIVELFGAILLSIAFSKYYSAGTAIWYGIFHSISAFCNAGIDIVSANGTNFAVFSSDPLVLIITGVLIIFGGLGFIVIIDILKNHSFRKFQPQTKIVLVMSSVLILLGVAIFLSAEWNNTLSNMSVFDKIVNGFFQSITTRTAGFSSISNAKLSSVSITTTLILMFIGASPGSTGGGLKTSTLFVLLASIMPTVKGKHALVFDKHKISAITIKKATAILMMALGVLLISLIALSITEKGAYTNEQLLFELISAYNTVGLSLDITANLSVLGKYILVLNMFLGRVGSMTFFIAMAQNNNLSKEPKIKYPEVNINL
ncbi:MAG TPA: potassium transporter TrkG [Clostridia bacterium]|nr:potassium transporter TrkG [Clostridia bacterium]